MERAQSLTVTINIMPWDLFSPIPNSLRAFHGPFSYQHTWSKKDNVCQAILLLGKWSINGVPQCVCVSLSLSLCLYVDYLFCKEERLSWGPNRAFSNIGLSPPTPPPPSSSPLSRWESDWLPHRHTEPRKTVEKNDTRSFTAKHITNQEKLGTVQKKNYPSRDRHKKEPPSEHRRILEVT